MLSLLNSSVSINLKKGIFMRRVIAFTLSSALVLQAVPLFAASMVGGAAAQEQVVTGVLNGTAQTSTGQTLSNYAVQARNLQTGQIAGTTTSNASGGFSFTGLSPANYVVEVVNQTGAIVGTSAAVPVVAGATATVAVSTTAAVAAAGAAATGAAAAGAAAAAGGGAIAGISTALVVTAVAVAAGVAGVVVIANDASPSR
jgi:hypothetical protein